MYMCVCLEAWCGSTVSQHTQTHKRQPRRRGGFFKISHLMEFISCARGFRSAAPTPSSLVCIPLFVARWFVTERDAARTQEMNDVWLGACIRHSFVRSFLIRLKVTCLTLPNNTDSTSLPKKGSTDHFTHQCNADDDARGCKWSSNRLTTATTTTKMCCHHYHHPHVRRGRMSINANEQQVRKNTASKTLDAYH